MELTARQLETIEALDRSFGYDSQSHGWEWDEDLGAIRFTRRRHSDGREESTTVYPIMLDETLAEWQRLDHEAGRDV